MAKTDVLQNGQYLPTEVGSTIYVWSPGGSKPPSGRTRSCVISAHGVESFISSKHGKPAGVELVYYCPHGWTLTEVDVGSVVTGELKRKETIHGSEACQDYQLSKLQGHGAFEHETYAHLQHGMHRSAQEKLRRDRSVLKPADLSYAKKHGLGYLETLASALEQKLSNVRDAVHDVVTIRDRTLFGAPTLFEVVARLEKAGFHYKEVHCAFCRGFASGTSTGWAASKRN